MEESPARAATMAPLLTVVEKPSNATYRGKATVRPDGTTVVVPDPNADDFPHQLEVVEVAWYEDRIKVTVKKGGPAYQSQVYLPGKGDDVIIELKPAP